MKSIYRIAKENNLVPMTLYKRIGTRGIKPCIVKGVMMLDENQEQDILVYAKRGRRSGKKTDQNTIK